MDNHRLIRLIKDPAHSTPDELKELAQLSVDHPYSAFLKIVLAKIAHVQQFPDEKNKVTSAAIATVDRVNFKSYLNASDWVISTDIIRETHPIVDPEKPSPLKEAEKSIIEPKHTPEKKKEELPPTAGITEKERLHDTPLSKQDEGEEKLSSELLKNIEEYKKNREHFEKLLDREQPVPEIKKPVKKTTQKKTSDKTAEKKPAKKDTEKKEEAPAPENKEIEKSAVKKPAKKKTSGQTERKKKTEKKQPSEEDMTANLRDALSDAPDIDTIRKVSEEKKAEGYEIHEEEDPKVIRKFLRKLEGNPEEGSTKPTKLKKEEQEEIIEQFIKTEPKIKKVKSPPAQKQREDLSLPSIKFSDNIISEHLAQIMINQGKLEKAIDIYKKLIWKFPQKKTYFASQIEVLKKKLDK